MILLQLYHCQNLYYDDHSHSYVINDIPNMSVICDVNLLSPYVLHGHKLFDGSRETYLTYFVLFQLSVYSKIIRDCDG